MPNDNFCIVPFDLGWLSSQNCYSFALTNQSSSTSVKMQTQFRYLLVQRILPSLGVIFFNIIG